MGVETRLAQPKSQTKANLSDLLQEGPGVGQGTEEITQTLPTCPELLGFAGRYQDED